MWSMRRAFAAVALTIVIAVPRAANAFRVVPPEQDLCAADSLLVVEGTVVDSGRFRKTSDGRRKIVTLRVDAVAHGEPTSQIEFGMMGTVEVPRVGRGTRLLLLLRVPPEGLPKRTTRDPYNGPRRVDWYEIPDTAPR